MVDVAMLDAAMVAMASTVSTLANGGIEPQPNGNIAASGSPASGIFETRDGLLSIIEPIRVGADFGSTAAWSAHG